MRWHLVSLNHHASALVCPTCWPDYQQTIHNTRVVSTSPRLDRAVSVDRLELDDDVDSYACSVCHPTAANAQRVETLDAIVA